jgi:membrane fusion protein, multidrug efflux system
MPRRPTQTSFVIRNWSRRKISPDSKADAANAQADQRKAQLNHAELNLSYSVIRSPVTGIVGKKTAEIGQNVSIGQELVDVVPLDDVNLNT